MYRQSLLVLALFFTQDALALSLKQKTQQDFVPPADSGAMTTQDFVPPADGAVQTSQDFVPPADSAALTSQDFVPPDASDVQMDNVLKDLGIPSVTNFDINEWFNWLKNNFIAISEMVTGYEAKLNAKKTSAAGDAMARFRAAREAAARKKAGSS